MFNIFGNIFEGKNKGKSDSEAKEKLNYVPVRHKVVQQSSNGEDQSKTNEEESSQASQETEIKEEKYSVEASLSPKVSLFPDPLGVIKKSTLRNLLHPKGKTNINVRDTIAEMIDEGKVKFIYRSMPIDSEVITSDRVHWDGDVLAITEGNDSPGFDLQRAILEAEGEAEASKKGTFRMGLEPAKNAAKSEVRLEENPQTGSGPEPLVDEGSSAYGREMPVVQKVHTDNNGEQLNLFSNDNSNKREKDDDMDMLHKVIQEMKMEIPREVMEREKKGNPYS